MSQQIQTFSVSAPGFFGLNTQDSPLDLAAGYAAIATNCVIDQYGRIGSRKGWSRVNTSSGNLGANNVTVIHELVQTDGTLTVLFAGNNKLFKLSGTSVVELTYGGGGRNSVFGLLLHAAWFRRGRSSNASQHQLLSMDDSVR